MSFDAQFLRSVQGFAPLSAKKAPPNAPCSRRPLSAYKCVDLSAERGAENEWQLHGTVTTNNKGVSRNAFFNVGRHAILVFFF
jgi:hypothetical protein